MPTFTPSRGHYLVRREDRTTTESGLIIPANAERHRRALVLSVGQPKITESGFEIPPSYKPMDRIMYFPNSGIEFDANGEKLLILQEKDILLRIDEK